MKKPKCRVMCKVTLHTYFGDLLKMQLSENKNPLSCPKEVSVGENKERGSKSTISSMCWHCLPSEVSESGSLNVLVNLKCGSISVDNFPCAYKIN